MDTKIALITIITTKFDRLVYFYRDVLGFEISLSLDNYVEFKNSWVRFSITTNKLMYAFVKDKSFIEEKKWQSFELAFPVKTPDDVDSVYNDIIKKWALPIKSPENMPWNQRTAFFSDPDWNIHEIFAELS